MINWPKKSKRENNKDKNRKCNFKEARVDSEKIDKIGECLTNYQNHECKEMSLWTLQAQRGCYK